MSVYANFISLKQFTGNFEADEQGLNSHAISTLEVLYFIGRLPLR